jgi:fatty-acid desaturase
MRADGRQGYVRAMAIVLAILGLLVANTLLGLGNTVGYHRMLTHRAFTAKRPVWLFFTLLGAMHGGSPIVWVALHRLHHMKSDGEGDPHSPRHGFWHAHCGWLIGGTNNPLVCIPFALSGFGQQGALLVHDILRVAGRNPPVWRSICPDLVQEPLLMALDFPFVMPAMFAGQLALAWGIGGQAGLWWLWALHTILTNGSWAVNSVAHWRGFGKESFDNGDDSRDVRWLAALTWGEGWHNGHHRFPRSAKHGLAGGFDASWMIIRGLERAGLVKDVWLPKAHREPVSAA